MSREEKFRFDVENIRKDLAMNDLYVGDNDMRLLRGYYNGEVTIKELSSLINATIWINKNNANRKSIKDFTIRIFLSYNI